MRVLAFLLAVLSGPDVSRAALDVDLEAGGETVRVIVTHLGLKPYERRFQVKKILALLKPVPLEALITTCVDLLEKEAAEDDEAEAEPKR